MENYKPVRGSKNFKDIRMSSRTKISWFRKRHCVNQPEATLKVFQPSLYENVKEPLF